MGAGYRAGMPGESEQRVGALQAAVFVDELALLAVLAVAGARLASGALGSWVLGIALPLAGAVVWGLWLAPRSGRRLAYPMRLAAKLALVVVASALLAAAGSAWWAGGFLVVSAPLLFAGELSER
jgi:hypothetical protein